MRAGIADYLGTHAGTMFYGDPGLDDTMGMVREQFYRFAQEKVTPSPTNGICATNSSRSMSSTRWARSASSV